MTTTTTKTTDITARRATFTSHGLGTTFRPLRRIVIYKTCNQAKRRPTSQVLSVVPFQGVASLGAGERVLPGRSPSRLIPIHHPLAQGVVRTRQTLWALPLFYATRKGGMLSVLDRFPLGIRQLQETQAPANRRFQLQPPMDIAVSVNPLSHQPSSPRGA